MAASGAAALAHSTSIAASMSSLLIPGSYAGAAASRGWMNLRECTVSILIQPESIAEDAPIARTVIEIRIFDYHDRLSLAGIASGKYRVQIVDGR